MTSPRRFAPAPPRAGRGLAWCKYERPLPARGGAGAKRRGEVLLALLLLLAPTLAGAAVQAPVAVMPFKNLGGDPALDWLKVGMSETMISDLHKGAGLQVVERAQLDKALAELALQAKEGTDETTASRAGKMVGAKTVVVGSFQASGKQLRIAARYVNVETGVVEDAAKVTGPLDEVFSLQDQVVAKLTGKPVEEVAAASAASPHAESAKDTAGVVKRSGKPVRKKGPKVVSAYRLYAMSLTTSSDAERVGYLKQSLQEDPDFTYSLDALGALEARMKGYAKAAEEVRSQRETADRSALELGDGTPQERSQRAFQLMTGEMAAQHWGRLLQDAGRVRALDLPAMAPGASPGMFAEYAIVMSHYQLKQRDRALQAGEQFLKGHPDSMYYQSVEGLMKSIISERRQMEEGGAEADKELADLAKERDQELAHPPRNGPNPVKMHSLEFRRCTALKGHHQFERAVAECQHYVDTYGKEPEPAPSLDFVLLARYYKALSLAELGRFAEAHAETDKLAAEHPEFVKKMSVDTVAGTWPKD